MFGALSTQDHVSQSGRARLFECWGSKVQILPWSPAEMNPSTQQHYLEFVKPYSEFANGNPRKSMAFSYL